MSTVGYATLTTLREAAPKGKSEKDSPPGVKTALDMVSALVPAEVLAAHGVWVSLATETKKSQGGEYVTTITDPEALGVGFVTLICLSVFLFVLLRIGTWTRRDIPRLFIPPLAFIAWTMLQKTTAFDAVWPDLSLVYRMGGATLLAIVLGASAVFLAGKADANPPP